MHAIYLISCCLKTQYRRLNKMAKETKIVNIRHRNYIPSNEELLILFRSDKFRYKFTTVVAYNIKTSGKNDLTNPQKVSFDNEKPFTIYRAGVSIAVLRAYSGNKIDKNKLLSARGAYRELENLASQCSERITADLCCQIIVEKIVENHSNKNLVFFTERSASNKMLGRVAALQLNLDNVTICFLTFNPSGLMTVVMSKQTSKLHFDINRLMSYDTLEFFGPYPGDSEDSLIQTYFHRPPPVEEGGGEYSPMRFDIFSQGLRRDEIDNKKEIVKEIFFDSKDTDSKEQKKTGPRKLVPMGWRDLKEYLDEQNDDIREKFREREE